jgi:hypothetical protein
MKMGILPRILIYNGGFYMIDGNVGRIGRNEKVLNEATAHLFRAKSREDALKKVESYSMMGFNCKYIKRVVNKIQELEDHLVVFTPNVFDMDSIEETYPKYKAYINRCSLEGAPADSFYNFLLNYEAYKNIDFGLIGEYDDDE